MITESYTYDHFVYKLSFPDGTFYIGCTCRLAKRLQQHEYESRRNPKMPLHKNIKKFGMENMSLKILHKIPHRGKARNYESRLIEDAVTNPKSLNRDSSTYRTFAIIRSHKRQGNYYDRDKFNKLKNKIGFINNQLKEAGK